MKMTDKNDVISLFVRFVDKSGGKSRPVLVYKEGDEVLQFFSITSQFEKKSAYIQAQYYPLKDWQQAGLDKRSWVDLGSRRQILKSKIKIYNQIGSITDRDIFDMAVFIKTITYNQQKVLAEKNS